MSAKKTMIQPAAAQAFAVDVLRALGMPEEDAVIAAEAMVWAGLRGAPSHGLARLDQIAKRAKAGGLSLATDWTPVRQRGNTTLLDAGYGWGIVAGTHGMRYAITAARSYGVGVTSVRNCDVTSIMGWYASRALTDRMIGLAINNGTPLMTAWGGASKIMGNQAFAIASPAGRHAPVILDMGIGAAGLGVLHEAVRTGNPLPPGTIVDADGAPTTDAAKWRDGGSLLPMGGHRGYGLGLMWEVLTGVLSGGHTLTEVSPPGALDQRAGGSLFLLAIDPAAFLPHEEFAERVDRLIDQVNASPPAPGVERVRVPGELRAELADERAREGIPLSAEHEATLKTLAEELGIGWPA